MLLMSHFDIVHCCHLDSGLMVDTDTCPSVGYVQRFNFTPKMKCLSAIPMSEHQGSDMGKWSKMKSPSNMTETIEL